MTCHITSSASLPDGTPFASSTIVFERRDKAVASSGGAVLVPERVTIQTNGTGAFSVDLAPGGYLGAVRTATGVVSFAFAVPDTATADLADLIDAAAIVAQPDAVVQAQAARDEAVAARDMALSVAAGAIQISAASMATSASALAAINAALSAYTTVIIPAGTWAINGTVVIPSGKTLTGQPGTVITTTAAQIFTMTGGFQSRVAGISVRGPNSGTSYQVILTDCLSCEVDIAIAQGNSGVQLIRSDFCKVRADLCEMRGSGIKLSDSQNNDIRLVRGRNLGGFGVYVADPVSRPSTKNRISADKCLSVTDLTTYQLGASFYNAGAAQIGLEAVGITVGNDGNIIQGVVALNTGDNGISISSDGNSGGDFVISICGNDGLHIYGSNNSFSSVTSRGNSQSGVGIGQGGTTGLAKGNTIVGATVDGNLRYGVELKDIATGNLVLGAIGSTNTLGATLDSSSGSNSINPGRAVATQSGAAVVSFVGVSDLSPGYSTRTANFQIRDGWCKFQLTLKFTPTYTPPGTPGEFRISVPGLSNALGTPGLLINQVTGITWPSGATMLTGRFENGTQMRVRSQGPEHTPVSLTTAHFTPGQTVELTITGEYPLA